MTQRSNTTVLEDGTVVPFVARMGGKKPGGSRKGYHAGDLLAAMTGAEESTPWPTVEKPKVLIESIRVVGPDDLTARDQAVYEFLLATARAKGMEKEKHTVPLKKVMEYLDVDSVERVVESLDRIARTVVKYDLRDDEMRRRGWLHLIQAEVTEDLGTGKADLTYSIPPAVRRVMMDSKASFRRLEVRAFPRFRCRYTARLYQRLALRAGYTHTGYNRREPWRVDPRKLAEELGYPVGDRWNFRHFERNVLKPAMKDIAEHVTRFQVICERGKTGPGRGSPVAEIEFWITPEKPPLAEATKRRLLPSEAEYVARPDPEHVSGELPSVNAIARAAGYLKRPADEVSDGFRAALALAKRNRSAFVTPHRAEGLGMAGGLLLSRMSEGGPDAALEAWVHDLPIGKEIVLERPPAAPDKPATPPAVHKPARRPAPAAPAAVPPAAPATPSFPSFPAATFRPLFARDETPAPARRRVVRDISEESMGIDRYAMQAAFGDFDDRDASDFEDEPEEAVVQPEAAPRHLYDPFDDVGDENFYPIHPAEAEEYMLPADED